MADSRMLLHRDASDRRHPRAQLVEDFVGRHGLTLLRAARRYSSNSVDAEDAYQRTLEALLTDAPVGDDDRLLAWGLTVVKNAALMENRHAAKQATNSFDEYAVNLSDTDLEPQERIVDRERFGQGREALRRIKPDQMRCLLLRADGLDYDEIIQLTGFSYAKVNRCLSEGRKAFRDRVTRLESGAECRRLDGVLSMMVDGAASQSARDDAELHLANCLHCQATLRDYATAPDRAAAALPVGLVSINAVAESIAKSGGSLRRISDWFESLYNSLQERLFGHVASAHEGAELALTKKAALVAVASASLIAGGVSVDKVVHPSSPDRHAADATATQPTTGAPTQKFHSRSSSDQARRGSPTARASRQVRAATEQDVVGKRAGTHVDVPNAVTGNVEGQSAADPNAFGAAPATTPSSNSSDGSSKQFPELAP